MRAPLPRLLIAIVVAGLVGTAGARSLRAAPRIEDVEDALGHDRSYKVRVDAALVLGRLHQTRSIPALIGGLKDPNPTVRASAARSLGLIGSPIARDAVAKALVDPVPLVRRMAKVAMKQLGGGDDDATAATPPPPLPGGPAIRARPGRKLSFEVKQMGDQSQRAGSVLRSHMRDFIVAQLRPFGDVAPPENGGMFAVDGVIKDLSTNARGGDVEAELRRPAGRLAPARRWRFPADLGRGDGPAPEAPLAPPTEDRHGARGARERPAQRQ